MPWSWKTDGSRSSTSLDRKILLGIVPSVLIALFGTVAASFWVARARILGDEKQAVGTFAEQTASTLRTFFKQRQTDLETLAESPLLVDYNKNVEYGLLQEAESYRREIEKYFLRFSSRTGMYDRILYVDRTGRPLAAVEGGRIAEARGLPNWAFVHQARVGDLEANPILNLQHGKTLTYAKAIQDEQGRFRGVLVLDCDLGRLEEVLRHAKVGEKGVANLTDVVGGIVLGAAPSFKDPILESKPIEGGLWRVTVAADPREFLAPLARLRDLTALFSILAGVLIASLLFWQIGRATRPIEEMAEGTKRLAEGELSYRFRPPDTLELRTLANAFNSMAESLERRTRELVSRIRQLTALREMEGAVQGRLSEDDILQTCLKAAVDGLGFDRGILYWVEDGWLVGRMAYRGEEAGLTPAVLKRRRIPLDSGDILGEVVRIRKPQLVTNTEADPRVNQKFVKESKTTSFILAPLCGKDKVLGVIGVDNRQSGRPLTEEDRDHLMLFANAAGLSLENAQLVDQMLESEMRHRQVLDGSGEVIIGLDRELKVTTFNRAAEILFGLHAAVAKGRPLRAVFPTGSQDALARLLAEAQAKGSAKEIPLREVPVPAGPRDLIASLGPTAGEGWSLVLRDETEKRQLQAQLIQSEKLSVVGKLISSVAHELNNPLATIMGYSQLFEDKEGDEEFREGVQAIHQSAVQCRAIIEELLLFVRKGPPEKKEIGARSIVQRALRLMDYRLRKAVRVKVTLRVPQGLKVWCDPQRLQQVIVNLVSNACDAMEEAGGPPAVTVTGSREADCVRLVFEDSGPGVPAELREKIFEAFFTTKGEGKGTGLGLAICRQIIQDHGGKLFYRQGGELGAAFVVELPLPPAARSTKVLT